MGCHWGVATFVWQITICHARQKAPMSICSLRWHCAYDCGHSAVQFLRWVHFGSLLTQLVASVSVNNSVFAMLTVSRPFWLVTCVLCINVMVTLHIQPKTWWKVHLTLCFVLLAHVTKVKRCTVRIMCCINNALITLSLRTSGNLYLVETVK